MFYNTILLEDEETIVKYYSLIKDTVEENVILLTIIIDNLHFITEL